MNRFSSGLPTTLVLGTALLIVLNGTLPVSAQAPNVIKSPVVSRSDVLHIENATLRYVEDLSIAAQADGLIMVLNADEGGDMLNAGDLIIELDSRIATSEVEVATQELAAADIQAKDTSEIRFSEASEAVAHAEYDIAFDLETRKAESKSVVRRNFLEWTKSKLSIDVAQIKHKRDESAREIAAAKLKAAQVQVALRKIQAPFRGAVVEMKKHKSDWVRAGEPILRYVSMDRLRVTGKIPTKDLKVPPHMLVSAPVKVEVEIFKDHWFEVAGHVGFVRQVQELDGSYAMWVEIRNDDRLTFREGMRAKMEITLPQINAPISSLAPANR